MQGPSLDIVRQTISTLVKSINITNGLAITTHFPLPFDCFDSYTEHYAEVVQLVRKALLHELDDRSICRYRNAQLPVGKLPTELLAEIFATSLATGREAKDTSSDMRNLHGLARLCTRWWQVIKSTPHFWVNVHSAAGPAVRHQLGRTGNLPLSITFKGGDHDAESFMELVGEYAHRWRSLNLTGNREQFAIIGPYRRDMPMDILEEVVLKNGDPDGGNIPQIPFRGGPKLRALHVSNLVLGLPDWTSDFSSITHLRIKGGRIPTRDYLPKLVGSCENLTELSLKYLEGAWFDRERHPTPVTLPKLERLKLHYEAGDPLVWVPLFQGMYAKNLKYLSAGDDTEGSFGAIANPPFVGSRPSILQSVLENVELGRITIDESSSHMFSLNAYTRSALTTDGRDDLEGEVIRLYFGDEDRTALQALRHVSFGSISIHLELDDRDDPSALQFLPGTVSINLEGTLEGARRYVDFFSRKDDVSGRWNCPLLRELGLRFDHPSKNDETEEYQTLMNDIQNLIQARRSSEAPAYGETHPPECEFQMIYIKRATPWWGKFLLPDSEED